MRKSKIIHPKYAERFRCLASSCDDTCCVGWNVEIDQKAYEKYRALPASPLHTLIGASIRRTPKNADASKPSAFATIQMSPSLRCPMHNTEGLCQIQVEYGETYLSRICSTFPRDNFTVDNIKVDTLSLSCPEAARIVLTNSELSNSNESEASYFIWDDDPQKRRSLRSCFWPIREFTVNLMENRSYPLWQRMFLLGSFSRRLEAVIRNEVAGGYSAMESGFSAVVSMGSLRDSIETIPAHNPHQLDLVLQFIKSAVITATVSPRYLECVNAFMEGIGGERATTFEDQCAAYSEAHERFYLPFFLRYPQMLENLLVNMVFRTGFPFGPHLFNPGAPLQPAKQYALLVTEFALIKGLLIGVAGYHKEAFSVEHVVRTVQVIVKYFEHASHFLNYSLELVTSKGLNDAKGLTMLLRN